MKNNKTFLFNNKKGLDVAGKIVAFFIVLTLGYLLINIFLGPKAIVETNINLKLMEHKTKQCKMSYDAAKESGDYEDLTEIDVDRDGCIDSFDICIVKDSKKDSDLDGIPDACDSLPHNSVNSENNKIYSQRLLCKNMGHYWEANQQICCSDDLRKETKVCQNAKR